MPHALVMTIQIEFSRFRQKLSFVFVFVFDVMQFPFVSHLPTS